MRNPSTARQMRQHFESIRDAISDMQKNTLKKISRLADDGVKARAKYNKDYFEQYKNEANSRTENEIAQIKTQTLDKIRLEFVAISALLNEWALSPVPESCAAVLRTYKDYGLTPTKSELELLTENAAGSYLASRIISGMAKSIGLVDDFVPLEQLRRSLTAAERDTETAVRDFIGIPDEKFRCTADMLNLHLSDNRNWIVYASQFLESDNSFSRIEKTLTECTETEFALAPSRRREIDRIFEGLSESDRVATAARLIESDDSMADLLSSYDRDMYVSALSLNAEQKRATAEKLLRDAVQTDRNADKAAREAITAQTRATVATVARAKTKATQ